MEIIGDVRPEDYKIPNDILSSLKSNEEAWSFYRKTSPSYQRIRAAYVDIASNRPEEFTKRLDHLIAKSANQKQLGYGIEDYY